MTQRKTVLVVEDQRLNQALVQEILGKDYNIIYAGNGQEAMDYLEDHPFPDAMLLDINMPVMDGYEVLMAMDKQGFLGEIPVLVASQEEREEAEIKALKLGASDYVTKPYNPEILRKRLGNLVRMKHALTKVSELERDSVTNLFNKAAFCDRVDRVREINPTEKFDIVVVDIEHFKLFNESYGFEEGDKLLQYIGMVLAAMMEEKNIICSREYADRFFLCVKRENKLFQEIHDQLTRAVAEYPLDIKLRLQFGIYQPSKTTTKVETMCDRAVSAVKRSQHMYDCDVAYYNDETRKQMYLEQEITNDMVKALANGEFQVYLQPKYDLFQEKMAGAEALVRWVHPQKGLISPGAFIPVFEQNGFITDLDMFIWEKTCQIISRWIKKDNKYVPVSVNVSRKDIYKENLPEIFRKLLKKYGLKPKHLHLEITESAYTENPDQLLKVVDELKAQGFTIEMDDFGSGYSSLNMLAKLPIDVLKLDMKIIQSYGEQNSSRSIINFIMGLARWMNLYVVAEGVETQKQIDFLKSLECNYVQGYYYSQPLPMEEFTKKLDESEVSLMPSADDESLNTQLIVHDYDKDQIMLVIDDLSMNRAIMTDCFKDLFSIIEANNGEAALNYFTRGGRADIIMLDIYMPQVDGFQVLSELKKTSYTKDIPVIITSQADDATIIRALKAGASDFLTKPYTKEDAVRCANRALAAAVRKSRRDEEDMRKRMTVLEKLATTDFLTGLWNSSCFEKKVVEYLNDNRDKICNLILIDIDNFKALNDSLGRKTGDELLQKLANRLLFCFREGDIICRISGDEFAVLMKAEMSATDLDARMRAFHKSMRTTVNGVPVTCSSGACRYPEGGRTYHELFENADKSLFQAKRNGKNQCVIYNNT